MPDAISSIRNLGPAMEQACARAGIDSAEQLRALGTDDAYARLLRSGHQPHFISYYVLEMALQGRPWNDCRGDEKARLRARFDRLKSENIPETNAMETMLNEIGVISANREAP